MTYVSCLPQEDEFPALPLCHVRWTLSLPDNGHLFTEVGEGMSCQFPEMIKDVIVVNLTLHNPESTGEIINRRWLEDSLSSSELREY